MNDVCHILKCFHIYKILAIPLIWLKSPYNYCVTQLHHRGKESGQQSESPLWRDQWCSFLFIPHADDVKREMRHYISRLLTNQKPESALSME